MAKGRSGSRDDDVARNMMRVVVDGDDDDVYRYYNRWRLKLEGMMMMMKGRRRK